MVTIEGVMEQGLEGLTNLPGIGPKKSEAILEFAEEMKRRVEAISIETEKEPKTSGISGDKESDLTEEDDEQEVPVNKLSEIDPSVVENLIKSGFETMAELSVTQKEELIEIEGIDEETAVTIIEQAKNQMESTGGV